MSEASYPEDLLYFREHDWARIDGDIATFGITWYAQEAIGEVVFFDPPSVADTVKADEPYAEIDSTKSSNDVFAPMSGEIIEVNLALEQELDPINLDPYGDGWLVKVKLSDPSEADALMDSAAYQAFIADNA